MLFAKSALATLPLAVVSCVSALPQSSSTSSATAPSSTVNSTTCNGKQYIYQELAGYGYILNNTRDRYLDTIGGIGSSVAIDRNSWVRCEDDGSYSGTLYTLPDRGWNTEGTLNYQNRIHKFTLIFTPKENATVSNPSGPNLQFVYQDTILLTDPASNPLSGLDAAITGPYKSFAATGELPSANYTGDGYGGNGSGGNRVVLDSEGLVLGADGTFWVSDEYGDYVYQFTGNGTMIKAIRPPAAFIPNRNNSESFSADSPPRYDSSIVPNPADPTSGRSNNQGLEGLTISPDGTKLYALTQSALIQDGGTSNKNTRYARLLVYDISASPIKEVAEYVVPLNHVTPSSSSSKIARQSELHYVSDTQFFTLARDSGEGRGQGSDNTQSIYRDIDVFDISNATNVAGVSDCTTCQVAKTGTLLSNVTAATYCRFLDFNVNSQLNRFGVHNGGDEDAGLLNEKWESIALVPVNTVNGTVVDDEYFLLSLSDNDFITQDGHLNFGQFNYSDSSGYNLDNQALLFKVKLPSGSSPLVG